MWFVISPEVFKQLPKIVENFRARVGLGQNLACSATAKSSTSAFGASTTSTSSASFSAPSSASGRSSTSSSSSSSTFQALSLVQDYTLFQESLVFLTRFYLFEGASCRRQRERYGSPRCALNSSEKTEDLLVAAWRFAKYVRHFRNKNVWKDMEGNFKNAAQASGRTSKVIY